MTLTREVAILMAIDNALTFKRADLTAWEIKFLNGLRSGHMKYSQLTVRQKTKAVPILKRLRLMPLSPKLPMKTLA
ncbi:hypothetical protein D3C77_316480 [compost metagenome]